MSLATAVLDNAIFAITYGQTGSIGQSQTVARVVAMVFNYLGMRRMVFHSQQKHRVVLPKYVLLVALNGLVSYGLIHFLQMNFSFRTIPAKLTAEGVLFIANFAIQRDLVFTRHEHTVAEMAKR